jgi:Protein of unknown function (DUF3365)
MKNLFFSLIIINLVLLIACQTNQVKISEPSVEEIQEIKAIGDTLSKRLLVALKSELSAAIQEKGVVNAIQVCNIKALPITAEIAQLDEYSVDIKRTTTKYRNAQNKPDDIEKIALAKYMEYQNNGQPLPGYYIQKISEGDKHYFNYYKPLKTAGLCLLCHGDPQTMDESLKDVLNRLYPDDLAIGYKEGDFRALLRIKVMDKK